MTPLYVKCYACGHKQVYSSIMKDVAGCPQCKSPDIKSAASNGIEPDWWGDSIDEIEQLPAGE